MVTSSNEEHCFVMFREFKLEKATHGPRGAFTRGGRPDAGAEYWLLAVVVFEGKSDACGESIGFYNIKAA